MGTLDIQQFSMFRPSILVLTLAFLASLRLAGQIDSSEFRIFTGIVVDDLSGVPLPSVHLWNESTRMGTISNGSGEFSISVRNQDTLVFSSIGYASHVCVVSPSLFQDSAVRLKPKKYEIDELVVRRFRSYESFKYHFLNLELPDSATAQVTRHIQAASINVAIKADRERAIKEKLETGRIGYITPLGKGINRERAFKKKMTAREKREEVIHAKFNRELVGDITHLDGDELTEFIAMCNFSEEYLYESDLYTIIEALYVKLSEYHTRTDTINY